MPPTLHYTPASPPARSVLITAKAIDLDVNLKLVDLVRGEHKTPEYTKLNPLQTVPVLEDDGFVVYDSHAIMIYLMDKYAKDDCLYPKDAEKKAIVNQRLFYESGILFPRLIAITLKIIFHNEKCIPQERLDDIKEAFSKLEVLLENDQYFAGNTVTLADFSIATTVTNLMFFVSVTGSNYPKLYAWLKRMETLPYFKDINQEGIEEFCQLMKAKLE